MSAGRPPDDVKQPLVNACRWTGRHRTVGLDPSKRMIQLVGPGGAGKTTVGAALAERLGVRFVDLDAEFTVRQGNISAYIETHGYDAYAKQNVDLYLDLVDGPVRVDILALSSGFMTYGDRVHPEYLPLRERVASSPSTFVLLPSVGLETCVDEIVRRQLQRPFARSAAREKEVIRGRFSIYFGLPARKVDTMRPTETVVAELVEVLAALASRVSRDRWTDRHRTVDLDHLGHTSALPADEGRRAR